jgi:twitching motility protein PilT
VKHAKTYVRVGRRADSSWSEPLGLGLEIVPTADPTSLRAGSPLQVRLLKDGQPLAGQRKLCLMSQREVGVHSASFANALHSALREDPDAILVGELRDLETMSIAMTAAEMGVLVMGTLHTNGAAPTIDRVVNIFSADKQDHVRNMLSTSLRGIVSQQLLKRKDGTGRAVALEILINTSAAANLIRQGKLEQLENVMQSSGREGMCTMDGSIKKLYEDGVISGEEAYLNAYDKSKFESIKDA